MSATSHNFEMPEVQLGDQVVFWEHYKKTDDPVNAWVARRPGKNTVYLMIFSESFGWTERPSVRHISDPGLKERTEWAKHGAWEEHETTKTVRELREMLPQLKELLAKPQPTRQKKAS
ncbi:MAG: hypothetical protein ACR2NI_11495 [Pirellulales bacterium]